MKVLIVNPIIYTSETAEIKKVVSIKDTMSYDLCLAFSKKGHEVTLVAGEPFSPVGNEEYPFEIIWAKCVFPKICKPNVLPFCPEVLKLVNDETYDLVISSEVFSLNSLMLTLSLKKNIIIWHELAKHNKLFNEIPSKLWYNIVAQTAFRNTPIIARSEEAKAFISDYCKNVKDFVIDHGVNLDKFEACKEKEKYFIVFSQLIERKQIDKIIDKFYDFSKSNEDYKLYIFGEGEKENELKKQAEALGDKVRFFGKVSHEELKDYLKNAAAMLVYTRKDNNMVSIVESIACATPIITTSIPYNASYIRENELGIVNDEWGEKELNEIINNSEKYINNCIKYREKVSNESKADVFIDARGIRNILLSSYSVNPYHGSEDGTGWNWTLQLAKHFNEFGDRIYLYTKSVNEADTRKGIEEHGLKNVELKIVDTPYWLNWYREHNSAFHHLYYIMWQWVAYVNAKKSKVDFDIIHHVTMGDFRIPGFMWKMKDAYKIFGPVGGGQSTPASLKDYENSKAVEKFRETVNTACSVLPVYKKAIKNFDRVFAVNIETQKLIEKALGRACNRLIELAPEERLKNLVIKRETKKTVSVLYMGRLINKKGIMLFLDVVNSMKCDRDFEVLIYGDGPLKNEVEDYIRRNSLESKVKLCKTVEHDKVTDVYRAADIFVMPSLRETGGNVIVEAMAHKLPVMALNMSISRDLCEFDCGKFVNTDQSKEDIINEFAEKLTELINNPEERKRLGENGYNFVNTELSWDKKFERVYKDLI